MKPRRRNDCVIVAVSKSCDVPYMKVKKRFGKMSNGTTYDECLWLLGQFADWKNTRTRIKRVDQFLNHNPKGRFLVVQWLMPWELHAVALVDGKARNWYNPDARIASVLRIAPCSTETSAPSVSTTTSANPS